MKIWMHVVAAAVGLAIAALIVFLVFGNASEQGARQDGSAPGLTATGGENLCGSSSSIATATQNLPALVDSAGREVQVSAGRADQKAWFGRLNAASGICIDEIVIGEDATMNIAMSVGDDVTSADAAAYVGRVFAAAFSAPLAQQVVSVELSVGGDTKTITMSQRAWRAFASQKAELGLETTATDIAKFRKRVAFAPVDLKITGW